MKKLITLILLITGLVAQAQKKELLEDKETILARASQALDAALQPGGALYEAVKKENLIGCYVIQVTWSTNWRCPSRCPKGASTA
jgi:hypothetical protein